MTKFIHDGFSLTFFPYGRAKTIPVTHVNFDEIVSHVVADRYEEAVALCEVSKFVEVFSDGQVKIGEDDTVLINGQSVSDYIVEKILRLHKAGESFKSLSNFAALLQSNPNEEVREDLYKWIEASHMPLTEDGHFIAYKKIQNDFFSFYSGPDGKVFHGIGEYVTMPREECNESRNVTCSSGLHFCSYTYLSAYYGNSGKVVAVMINPKDVTAIPRDYNLAKGRGCAYLVLNEVDPTTVSFAFSGTEVYRGYGTNNWEDDEYCGSCGEDHYDCVCESHWY